MTAQDLDTALSFFAGLVIGNYVWYLALRPWLEKNYYRKEKNK